MIGTLRVKKKGSNLGLCSLFQLEVQLILTGVDRHPGKGIHSYQQYLDHIWQVRNLGLDKQKI